MAGSERVQKYAGYVLKPEYFIMLMALFPVFSMRMAMACPT